MQAPMIAQMLVIWSWLCPSQFQAADVAVMLLPTYASTMAFALSLIFTLRQILPSVDDYFNIAINPNALGVWHCLSFGKLVRT